MKPKVIFLVISFLFSGVILKAQASFTITPNICKHNINFLTANTGSLTNCTFTWTALPGGANFSSPGASTTNISFTNTGNYTVTLTIMSGTTVSFFQNTIAVLSLPTVTLTQASFTTCITSNFPLFSKPVHLTASGGLTYTWNPPLLIGNPNGPTTDVRPSANACFSVTGSDANGCKAMSNVCVTVIPRFTVNVTPVNTLICKTLSIDQTANLTVNNPSSPAVGLPSSHTYSWSPNLGSILTPPFNSIIAVSPWLITTYTAEVRDSINCVSLPAIATVSVYNCTDLKTNFAGHSSFSIYPNPVKDKLYIESTTLNQEKTSLTLINSLGQIVFSFEDVNEAREFDVQFLTPGVYFLQVQNGAEIKRVKVLKD